LSLPVVSMLSHCRAFVPVLLSPEGDRHGVGILQLSSVGCLQVLSLLSETNVVHSDH